MLPDADADSATITTSESSPLRSPATTGGHRRAHSRLGNGWYAAARQDVEAVTKELARVSSQHRRQQQHTSEGGSGGTLAAFLKASPRHALWAHQEEGIAFMRAREQEQFGGGGIVADEMRTGKTLMFLTLVLATLQADVRAGRSRFGAPTLFCTPPLAIPTLLAEVRRHFGDAPGCPLKVLVYSAELSCSDIVERCDILVVSYSMLTAQAGTRLAQLHFSRIIADEAHHFANTGTLLFGTMCQLQARWRWFVTGTPLQNSVADLLSALQFLRVPAPFPPVGSPEFQALLHGLMLRRRAVDVGLQARAQADDKAIFLAFHSSQERRLYDRICSDTQVELRGQQPLDTASKLTIILRLRQVCVLPCLAEKAVAPDVHAAFCIGQPERCSALGYMSDALVCAVLQPNSLRYRHDKRTALLQGLSVEQRQALFERLVPPISTKERYILQYYEEFIEHSSGDEKLVVFSEWAGFLDHLGALFALRSRLRRVAKPHVVVHGRVASTARAALFARFRADPQCRVLLLTFGTGRESLDLSCANHAIIPDPWFNPFTEDQVLARLGGTHQRRQIHYRRLYMEHTIDEEILRLAEKKRDLATLLEKKGTASAKATTIPDPLASTVNVDGGVSSLIAYILAQGAEEDEEEKGPAKKKPRR